MDTKFTPVATTPELLERLLGQCDRLRLPGQQETNAEKVARSAVASNHQPTLPAADDSRPWISHGAHVGFPLVNGEYFMVHVSLYSGDHAGPARAARIAACMNACHGMEDDVLWLLNDFAPRATRMDGGSL